MPSGYRYKSRGFTLIELIAVVTIILLISCLIISATQSARETSRRLHCLKNLSQIGMGLSNYYSAFLSFPPPSSYDTGYSLHVSILPFMEQTSLYNAINHRQTVLDALVDANSTVFVTGCQWFLCPSDSYAGSSRAGWGGAINYAGCIGDAIDMNISDAGGVFGSMKVLDYQGITDGASSTVAVSEFLVGIPGKPERLRALFIPIDFGSGPANNLIEFEKRCTSLSGEQHYNQSNKGNVWMIGAIVNTLYDNTLGINSPSCLNTSRSESVKYAISASSMHPAGANTLFADGHARFLSQSISSSVWRALGSRRSGEIISSDVY